MLIHRVRSSELTVPWHSAVIARLCILAALAGPWSCCGCASGARRIAPAQAPVTSQQVSADSASVQTPARSLMTLADIQPAPTAPAPGNEIPPLSQRGATPVAAAKALIAEQRYTEASLELERALRYDPQHPEVHRTLATLHIQAGNRERARSHVVKALEISPDDGSAHYLQGRLMQLDGDYPGAISAYRTALLCPAARRDTETTLLAHYHLAEALQSDGYETAALEEYAAFEREAATAVGTQQSPQLLALIRGAPIAVGKARADILEKLGRPADAADALQAVTQAAPQDLETALRRCRLLLQAGKLDDALAAIRAVPADAPDVLKLLTDIHMARGTTGELIADLRERLSLRPGDGQLAATLADLLTRDGRPAEAVDLLRAQLERNPESVELRLHLMEALRQSKQWDALLTTAAEGLAKHPARSSEFESRVSALRDDPLALEAILRGPPDAGAPRVLFLRAIVARDTGRWELAATMLNACVTAEPRFASAREALARMYFVALDYEKALAAASRQEAEVAEDPRLELTLGDIFERLDDLDMAEFHYNAAIQLDRGSTAAMMRLAEIHARTDRVLQAQRQLRSLLELDPQHESARETLAFLLLKQGKVDAALQQFLELKKRATTPAVRARSEVLAAQYPRINPEDYRNAMIKAMQDSAPDAASWVIVAESYDENSETEKRYDAFMEALRVDPEHEEAVLGLVSSARRLLRFDEAARRLAVVLPRRPNRHTWRFMLIELHWILQNYDRALALAESEARRPDLDDESRTGYRLRVIDSLRFAGRKEEALGRMKEYAESTGEREWRDRLANTYLRDDRAAEAVAIYEELYRTDGGLKNALSDVVEALGAAKRYDRAAQYAVEWLAEDPDNDRAVALVAFALSAAQRADDTLELVRAHLARTLNREFFQDLLMRQLRIADRHREATQWIESLLDAAAAQMQVLNGDRPRDANEAAPTDELIRRPNEPYGLEKLADRIVELRLELGRTRIAARDFSEAERLYTDWLQHAQDPRQRVLYLRDLSALYQAQGFDVKSTEVLEKVLALTPNNVGISNDLAYGWIDQGIRIPEAERLIRFALASAPREGAYLDTFGWLLYKKGEFAEAKKWLEMAHRDRAEDDPVVLDHLGDAMWRLGEKEEAIARWDKAAAKAAEKKEEEVLAADLRRVRAGTRQKADDARAGREPKAAPLAVDIPVPAAAPDSQ